MSWLSSLFGGDAGRGDEGTGYADLGEQSKYAGSIGKLGDYEGDVFYGADPTRVQGLKDEAAYWDDLARKGLTQGQQDTLLAGYAGDPNADAARATAALEQSEALRGLSPGGSTDAGARADINTNFIQAYNQAKAKLGQVKMNLPGEAMTNRDNALNQITSPALAAATNGWGNAGNIYGNQAGTYFGLANQKRQAQQQAQSQLLSTIGGIAGAATGGGWSPFAHAASAAGGMGASPAPVVPAPANPYRSQAIANPEWDYNTW